MLSPAYKAFCFLLFFTFPLISFAQDGNPFTMSGPEATAESILLEILQYPINAAREGIKGRVAYKVKINESGKIEGFTLVEESHPYFQVESQKAMNYLKAGWYPELIGNKSKGQDYLVVMSFSIVDSRSDPEILLAQIEKWIEKDKSKKALKSINQLITTYPYEKEYLQVRGQIFAEMGKEKESREDLEKASELENLILAHTLTLVLRSSRVPISF